MKTALFVFPLLLLATTALAEDAKRTLNIAWIGPLTGDSAVLGIDSARAAELALEEANADGGSVQFKLLREDDGYSTPRSVSAYRKLVNVDKVRVVLLLTYGGLFALAPEAERASVLLLDPLDCNEQVARLPSYTLCFAAMTEGIGELNAKSALQLGHKRAAIFFFQDDPFMATVVASTEKALAMGGAAVVLKAGHGTGQTDFRSLLIKAKAANVDSIYFYGYDEAAAGMKQARELGIKAQFVSTALVASPSFLKVAGAAAEGAIFTVYTPPSSDSYRSFLERFKGKFGREPILDIATVPSYDIVRIITQFAKHYDGPFESEAFAAALRKHFTELREFDGASGRVTMSPDGATRTLELGSYRFQGGQRHLLELVH